MAVFTHRDFRIIKQLEGKDVHKGCSRPHEIQHRLAFAGIEGELPGHFDAREHVDEMVHRCIDECIGIASVQHGSQSLCRVVLRGHGWLRVVPNYEETLFSEIGRSAGDWVKHGHPNPLHGLEASSKQVAISTKEILELGGDRLCKGGVFALDGRILGLAVEEVLILLKHWFGRRLDEGIEAGGGGEGIRE